jgi:hypothetical protein
MKFTISIKVIVLPHIQETWTEKQLKKATLKFMKSLPPKELINDSNQPFHQTDLIIDKYKVRTDICVTVPKLE